MVGYANDFQTSFYLNWTVIHPIDDCSISVYITRSTRNIASAFSKNDVLDFIRSQIST